MILFQDRYRIPSARWAGKTYAEPGLYFVTICTQNRIPWFGEIRNGIMGLSEMGCVVHTYWEEIPKHFPHVRLDRFVVMPNHIHGIIVVEQYPEWSMRNIPVETCDSHVSTVRHMCRNALRAICRCRIPRPVPGSIGSIITQFKSATTKRIWSAGFTDFRWQQRFYDHVIRNERSLNVIRSYIENNPARWDRDRKNK